MKFGSSTSRSPAAYAFQTVSAAARSRKCFACQSLPPTPGNGWNFRPIKAFYDHTAIDETTNLERTIARPNNSYIARNFENYMMLDSIDPDFEVVATTKATELELIRFMNNWNKLSEKRDTAALDRMLPEDLIITTSDGRVLDKHQFIDNIKNMPEDFRLRDHEKTVQIFDHTAIVRAGYVLEMNGSAKNLRYTATFIKRGGKWEVVSLQSSLLTID